MPKRYTLKVLVTVPDNHEPELVKRQVKNALDHPNYRDTHVTVVQVDDRRE